MKKKSMVINIPIELYEKVESKANNNLKTITGYILDLITNDLYQNEYQNEKINDIELKRNIFEEFILDKEEDIGQFTDDEILEVFNNEDNDFLITVFNLRKGK